MTPTTVILTICSYFALCTGEPSQQSMEEMIRATCLEKSGFRPLDSNNTLFRVVEVVQGANISLPCTYCGESTEEEPRIWRWRPMLEHSDERELKLGLAPELEANRLLNFPNHTLVIHDVTMEDAGLYTCAALGQDDGSEFRFSVDVVRENVTVVELGKMPWAKFEKEMLRANEKIYQSGEPEVDDLLDKIKIKVVSEWDPWLPCDGCASLRHRYSKCRLHSYLNLVKYPSLTPEALNATHQLIHLAPISCHSLHLALWFPAVFDVTSGVPHLRQVQTCYDSCRMEDRLAHEARYHTELRMDVGSSLAFICPETSLGSKVKWKKDGVTMKPVGFRMAKKSSKLSYYKKFFRRPSAKLERAFVDRMNTLQLCLVGPAESAVYTCYLDKAPVKSFNITVVTAEETLRQRRYHFWLLSCYTSLLSSVVVSIGILWAFLRRHEFIQIVEERQ